MLKRLLCVVALSCVCGTALAHSGFEPLEELAPDTVGAVAIAVADVSGDARDDLVVLSTGEDPDWSFKVLVYAQTENGDLAPAATYPYGAQSAARLKLVDLDSDGDQDIVVSHVDGWSVLRNEGELQFSLSTYQAAAVQESDFDFMDVDVDGNLDIVAMSEWQGSAVYFGDGQCGFRERVALDLPGGTKLHLVDMNRDGRRDIAYARIHGQGIFVHLHENGGFSSGYAVVPLGMSPSYEDGVLFSDINGDGLPEIVFSHADFPRSEIFVYGRNHSGPYRRKRTLSSSLLYGGFLDASDIDGDGLLDLVQTSASSHAIGVHFGEGGGFGAQAKFFVSGLNRPLQIAFGDLNGDGRQDVVTIVGFGAVSYLRGRATPTQADLGVSLGLTATSVAVRIDNYSESDASHPYELTLQLDARFGSVSAGSVPQGCYPSWIEDGVYLWCPFEGLAAGSSRTLIVPITLPLRSTMNRLTASARLLISTDLRSSNNRAWKAITIPAVSGKARR